MRIHEQFGRNFLTLPAVEQRRIAKVWVSSTPVPGANEIASQTQLYIDDLRSDNPHELKVAYTILSGLILYPSIWPEVSKADMPSAQLTDTPEVTVAKLLFADSLYARLSAAAPVAAQPDLLSEYALRVAYLVTAAAVEPLNSAQFAWAMKFGRESLLDVVPKADSGSPEELRRALLESVFSALVYLPADAAQQPRLQEISQKLLSAVMAAHRPEEVRAAGSFLASRGLGRVGKPSLPKGLAAHLAKSEQLFEAFSQPDRN